MREPQGGQPREAQSIPPESRRARGVKNFACGRSCTRLGRFCFCLVAALPEVKSADGWSSNAATVTGPRLPSAWRPTVTSNRMGPTVCHHVAEGTRGTFFGFGEGMREKAVACLSPTSWRTSEICIRPDDLYFAAPVPRHYGGMEQ